MLASHPAGSDFQQISAQDDLPAEMPLRGLDPHLPGDLRIVGGYEVRENQCTDASGFGDPPRVLR
jgi:hypothetical protein